MMSNYSIILNFLKGRKPASAGPRRWKDGKLRKKEGKKWVIVPEGKPEKQGEEKPEVRPGDKAGMLAFIFSALGYDRKTNQVKADFESEKKKGNLGAGISYDSWVYHVHEYLSKQQKWKERFKNLGRKSEPKGSQDEKSEADRKAPPKNKKAEGAKRSARSGFNLSLMAKIHKLYGHHDVEKHFRNKSEKEKSAGEKKAEQSTQAKVNQVMRLIEGMGFAGKSLEEIPRQNMPAAGNGTEIDRLVVTNRHMSVEKPWLNMDRFHYAGRFDSLSNEIRADLMFTAMEYSKDGIQRLNKELSGFEVVSISRPGATGKENFFQLYLKRKKPVKTVEESKLYRQLGDKNLLPPDKNRVGFFSEAEGRELFGLRGDSLQRVRIVDGDLRVYRNDGSALTSAMLYGGVRDFGDLTDKIFVEADSLDEVAKKIKGGFKVIGIQQPQGKGVAVVMERFKETDSGAEDQPVPLLKLNTEARAKKGLKAISLNTSLSKLTHEDFKEVPVDQIPKGGPRTGFDQILSRGDEVMFNRAASGSRRLEHPSKEELKNQTILTDQLRITLFENESNSIESAIESIGEALPEDFRIVAAGKDIEDRAIIAHAKRVSLLDNDGRDKQKVEEFATAGKSGRTDYDERRKNRIERLEAKAAKLQKESERTPIFSDRAFKKLQEAKEAKRKAEAAKRNTSLSSDDPEVIQKLKTQLERETGYKERMKKANRLVKKPNAEKALKALGYTDQEIHRLKNPRYSFERVGHQKHELESSNRKIASLKDRISQEEAKAKLSTSKTKVGDAELMINKELNRMQIRLPFKAKKGSPEHRALRSRGFIYSYRNDAFQRQLNQNAIYAAEAVAAELVRIKKEKGDG